MFTTLTDALVRIAHPCAEDAYQLNEAEGEHWVTLKNKSRIVINGRGRAVFGNKKAVEAFNNAKKWRTGTILRPEWKDAIERLSGFGPEDAYNHAVTAFGMLRKGYLDRFDPERRRKAALGALIALSSYPTLYGDQLGREYFAKARESLREISPDLENEYPEFFDENFYDHALAYFRAERQAANIRQRTLGEIDREASRVTDPAAAKDLLVRIAKAKESYGDLQSLREAERKATAIASGSTRSEGQGSRTALSDPEFPASLDELTEIRPPASFAKGYTKPRLFVDGSGKKWVLKDGGAEGHALAEWEASQAYRALGIRAPASRMYGDKRLAEYIEGKELGEYLRNASAEDRKRVIDELRADFAADVVLGNHDLIGDDEDNVMVGEDGHVWRVDCGGALGRKGAGPVDSSFADGWVDDIWTMRGLSPRVDGDMTGVPANEELKRYFGDITTHDLLTQAAALPLDRILPHLEKSQFSTPPKARGSLNQRVRLSTGRRETMERRIREIRSLAATSDGIVTSGNYPHPYNDRLLRMNYALMRSPFRDMAASIGRGGMLDNTTSYLVSQKLGGVFKDSHTRSELEAESVKAEGSLDSHFKKVARDNGVDLSRTDDMFADQGRSSSRGTLGNKLKVLELAAMGHSLRSIMNGAVPDLAPHIRAGVAKAASDYLRGDRKDFERDQDALMFRKAAMMQFFQNTNLPNYDPSTQRLLCLRTETSMALGEAVRKRGEVLPAFPRDSHASYSWYQTCCPNGDHLIAVSVPISRITSCDIFGNSKGGLLYNQINRNETEVGVNATGLPFVYLGRTAPWAPVSDYFKAVSDAEARSGRTLAGETFRDGDEYIRMAAPWARSPSGQDCAMDCSDGEQDHITAATSGLWARFRI